MAKLDVKALGLALGTLWGASVLILGLTAMLTGYCANMVNALGTAYIGYKATVLGSLIGGIWAFVDGGIGGLILAWLYNKFAKA